MRFGDKDAGVTIALGKDGVADVRLSRPAKLNALTPALMAAIADALGWLSGEAAVRCVVLSGEGRSFCAGIDLSVLASGQLPDLAPRTHGTSNIFQHCAMGWRELPVPVIAAIRGHCFGGGLQIALGADIRIAREDARLAVMEMRHGIVPDMGLFVLARGVVAADRLAELTFTAREFTGADGKAYGLVTQLADDPLDSALALARQIVVQSPPAVRAAKRLWRRMGEDDAAALLQAESDEQAGLLRGAFGSRD